MRQPFRVVASDPAAIDAPAALAALTGKLWQPGRTLRVTFLDGAPEVQTHPTFCA